MVIDISFDFRTDAGGRDADAYSPTLRKYHKLLWGKPLPCGRRFDLTDTVRGVYLHHSSNLGQFFLCSDSIMHTYTKWESLKHITGLLPEEENEAFRTVAYTIGGYTVFPGNKIAGKQTINVARGFNGRISDRFDLTLECIRRHYARQNSPLAETLARYHAFFALFQDFSGYVDFFLLHDLVTPDSTAVRFLTRFDDFKTPAVPKNGDEYRTYRRLGIEFVQARNQRIAKYDALLG